MKKIYIILIVLAVLCSVVGCSQNKETPTNVISQGDSLIETVVSELETSPVSDVVKNEASEQDKKEEDSAVNNTVTQKTQNSVKSESKEEVMSFDTDDLQTEEDIIQEEVKFASEAELINWLKNQENPENQFSVDALATMQRENTITYLKPKVSEDSSLVELVEIGIDSASIHYCYRFLGEDTYSLTVFNCLTDFDNEVYIRYQERVSNGKENYYYTEVNEIEYYYMRNEKEDATVIRWMQGDIPQVALLYGHFEQIDEILPLLELQQVTVQTNNDHVTQ